MARDDQKAAAQKTHVEIGSLVGQYQLVHAIGKGGMGEVYLAHDTETNEDVALKLLAPKYASNPALLELFVKEALLSAKLSHPNVVDFIDNGCADNQHYIALEYVTGLPLDKLMERSGGALQLELALSVLQDLTFGLEAVHRERIVHRDIKPQNVLITGENVVKLIDFGIAVIEELDEDDHEQLGADRAGTILYAAPEQVMGKGVDTSSDIFALGLVFIEMLWGEPVIRRGSRAEIMQQRMQLLVMPKVSSRRSDIPSELDAIAAKMVRHEPSQRFQSARELSAALSAFLQGHPALELSSPALDESKRLARLDLAESRFWQGTTYVGEAAYGDALYEFEQVILLQQGPGKFADGLREQLFKVIVQSHQLHITSNGQELPLEHYLVLLERSARLCRALGDTSFVTVIEGRLALLLHTLDTDGERLSVLRRLFAVDPTFEKSVLLLSSYRHLCKGTDRTAEAIAINGPLAMNLMACGELEGAMTAFTAHLADHPDDEQARDAMQAVVEETIRLEAERHAIEEHMEAGDAGLPFVVSHLTKFPADMVACKWLARHYAERKAYQQAAELWRRLGRYNFGTERFSEASHAFGQAIACGDDSLETVIFLIELLYRQGRLMTLPSDRRELVIAVAVANGHLEALATRAVTHPDERRDLVDELQFVAWVAKRYELPIDESDHYCRMALAAINCRRFDDLSAYLERSLAKSPPVAKGEICFIVGRAAHEKGARRLAQRCLERAKKLAPRGSGMDGRVAALLAQQPRNAD